MALPIVGIVAAAVAKKLVTRAVGGIVGAGSKSINPIYKQVSPSVKTVPGNSGGGPSNNFNELLRKGLNKDADTTALKRKSGELAKTRASQVDVGKPAKIIKINSAPKRTSGGK